MAPSNPGFTTSQYGRARTSLNVLVVGGGIAGLATAYTLQRAGHKVTVLEATDGSTKSSGTLNCPPNMTRVLESWGLKSFIQEKGVLCKRFEWKRGDLDEVLGYLYLHERFLAELMVNYYIIQHNDLYDKLLELATSSGAKVKYNSAVTALDLSAGQVTLQSGDTLKGQLLVGADGSASLVRASSLDQSKSHVQSVFEYTASIPISRTANNIELPISEGSQVTICPAEGYFVFLDTIGDLHHLSYVWLSDEEQASDLPAGWTRTSKSPEDYGLDVSDTASLFGPLLKYAQECFFGLHQTSQPLKAFVDGEQARCMVVGDAAHPLTPGSTYATSLAIEDAEVIGGLLSKIQRPFQLQQLLVAYEELRQPRCAMMQRWDLDKRELLSLRKGPEQKARDEALIKQMVSAQYEEFDEQTFMETWSEEVLHYNYHADEVVEDWWSKWGSLLAIGQPMTPRRPTIVAISRGAPSSYFTEPTPLDQKILTSPRLDEEPME